MEGTAVIALWLLLSMLFVILSLTLVSCFMLSSMISREEEEEKEDYREW